MMSRCGVAGTPKDASHVATGGIVGRGQTVPVMFELIPQAREVYNIIRKAQRAI
jgi:hypothetical protein